MRAGWCRCWIFVAAILPLAASFAQAKDAPKSIWEQDTLTGDWGGARTTLKDKYGIDIAVTYINEVLDVLHGGLAQRGSYEGRLDFTAEADLEKLVGWKGASAHVTVYQIHGSQNNAAANAGSIADPSNIDAVRTTRLFTAWFQQNFMEDRVSLRAGQLAADDEFLVAPTAGGLINGTFGWASILAANVTSGGPAYPLAAPGARLALKPTDEISFLTAVFSGDPAGGCAANPQVCNLRGTTFSFDGGALWINELQYGINQAKNAQGMPGVYKLGLWYASADYPDVSLPAAPLTRNGNWGIYGVADQMVWRGEATSLNLFMRAGAVPSDRNTVAYYVDGGAGFKGLLPGRPDDNLTFGAAYQNISRDLAAASLPVVLRHEVVFEASYQAQIAPWWILQPDFQYIAHPGGDVAVPAAVVVGLRSTIKF
jgi:porin